MVELNQITSIIEERAPLSSQESWDNSGWQVRVGDGSVSRILVALEVNQNVVEEAIRRNAELIVCHHPLIFGGIKSVDNKSVIGTMIVSLVSHGISVYATHTPFDKCSGGNNDYLAKLLELAEIQPIPGDESGICRMGRLKESRSLQQIIDGLGEKTGQDIRNYKLVGNPETSVETVGMCTGAGAEFMDLAASAGCSLFVTGDVKYHTAQHALELGIALLDMGHFGSEQIFTENMAEILRSALGDCVKVLESETDLNPFTVIA